MRTRFLLGLSILIQACALSDLRPSALRSAPPSAAAKARGRALLSAAARAHGLAAYQSHKTLTVIATDDWDRSTLGRWFSWWKAPVQRLEHSMVTGSFTSQMKLLDGPEKGLVIGLQNWRLYQIKADQVQHTPQEERTRFYPPALHYFHELPFRLLSAPDVVALGKADFAGRSFERVFVTWGGVEPHEAHDQYVVWIDAKTGWIASCRYTVREAFDSATGTIFFEDFRKVDGVWIPFVQTIVLDTHEDLDAVPKESWFHRLQLEHARFDQVTPEALMPLPAQQTGDRKPQLSAVH